MHARTAVCLIGIYSYSIVRTGGPEAQVQTDNYSKVRYDYFV